jgi:microcystin-dependent protein
MDSLLGSIVRFAFNFTPSGWLLCNGQTLDISTYQALYSLIGTRFGGNGTSNFCLPNLNNAALCSGNTKYYISTQGLYPSRS